ncbi:MAG TPA: methylmalonyl-CoA mutase family protein [Bacillota bacterium]
MMIEQMKSTSFKQADYATWQEVAAKSLRGRTVDTLTTMTEENIEIQPLYTIEQLDNYSDEKVQQMIQAVRQGKAKDQWVVAQQLYATTGELFLEQLDDSLKRGNEAVVYDGSQPIAWEEEQLEKLAQIVIRIPVYALNVAKDDLFLTIFERIPEEKRSSVQGAVSGESIVLPGGYRKVRTICADSRQIHHDGADSVTELATTLAKAAEVATSYEDFSTFADKFFVRFSIDTHFFMEIAKIRAFRVLWQTFSEAYGETKNRPVPVYSETSLRSYSKLDPYVNLLRAGNEALSAVLGGTDILTVHPHDILTGVTPNSFRLARNVQLVIKEETLVGEVTDPAGGSYFIESLTKQLVEKAWNFFLEIEEKGGYKAYVSSGQLDNRLEKMHEYRMDQLVRNKKSLIGTNVYANLTDEFDETEKSMEVAGRLAKPYEEFRGYFQKEQPKIALLTFGKLADFKPRADFVSGYLATGGLQAEWSPAFSTVKEAYEWIENNPFDYGVICASVAETEQVVNEFVAEMPKSLWIDVAGTYAPSVEKSWIDAGVSGFVYKGQDQIAKLTEIKNKWRGDRRDA